MTKENGTKETVNKSQENHAIREMNKIISNNLKRIFHSIAELNKRGRIHGIDHIVNNKYHPLERFLWFSVICCTIFSGIYIGKRQMQRYNANPTVISLERGNFILLFYFLLFQCCFYGINKDINSF